MPRAAKTLLEAVDRYPYGRREDRLTEVFACVLEAVHEFACWFIEEAGGPAVAPGERVAVTTQGMAGGSGRPDMIIDYGEHRILSEHKIGPDLTDFQRVAYADWRCDSDVLVAPDAESYRIARVFKRYITWLRVAQEVDRLGGEDAGSSWRRRALEPDSSGRLRCLAELLAFLECQDVGVSNMSPIKESAVRAYRELRATRSLFETFLAMVRDDPRIQALAPSVLIPQKDKTQWWFSLDAVEWPYLVTLDPTCGAEIVLEPTADWLADDSPVLYAGFYFATPEGRLPAPFSHQDSPLQEALRAANVQIGLRADGKQGKCAVTLYLSDLAAQGGTVREQAEYAAGWAVDAVEGIRGISG